jgi:hypothetical protein
MEEEARKNFWRQAAAAVLPGSSIRAKAAEEAAKKAMEEIPKPPPPPDPNEVAVRAWVIRDEATALALEALIDKAILVAAGNRRNDVHSHSAMAFSEGVCAGLEALKLKLTNLRTS